MLRPGCFSERAGVCGTRKMNNLAAPSICISSLLRHGACAWGVGRGTATLVSPHIYPPAGAAGSPPGQPGEAAAATDPRLPPLACAWEHSSRLWQPQQHEGNGKERPAHAVAAFAAPSRAVPDCLALAPVAAGTRGPGLGLGEQNQALGPRQLPPLLLVLWGGHEAAQCPGTGQRGRLCGTLSPGLGGAASLCPGLCSTVHHRAGAALGSRPTCPGPQVPARGAR